MLNWCVICVLLKLGVFLPGELLLVLSPMGFNFQDCSVLWISLDKWEMSHSSDSLGKLDFCTKKNKNFTFMWQVLDLF